ncbi:MAG: hypothetical protein IJ355_08525, partial [Prevotella sp.]|nr:hypothetical protein [Prevotella sp.]
PSRPPHGHIINRLTERTYKPTERVVSRGKVAVATGRDPTCDFARELRELGMQKDVIAKMTKLTEEEIDNL